MSYFSHNADAQHPSITLACNSTSSLMAQMTLSDIEISFLESTITELYISSHASKQCRKYIQKMCIKIDNWRKALSNKVSGLDLTINSDEISHIRKSIQAFINTLPLTCTYMRNYSLAMLSKFSFSQQECYMAA